MSVETSRAELTVPKDKRLFGALAAVIFHAGQRTGLDEAAQGALSEAAMQACDQALELAVGEAGEEPKVNVTVENFDDRVEVTVEHHGAADPAAGLDTFVAGGEGKSASALQGTGVDRVQYEARDGWSRTRLIKYAAGKAPRN
ncbi:MAG TPA: hypothetical protein VMJ93_15375 [Verrucomicrobiae bacterium]|nr:hypothetical protein [Verrucomicrobiae bacterium]